MGQKGPGGHCKDPKDEVFVRFLWGFWEDR